MKTRIEQMTQRKGDIFPFDSLVVTLPETPRAGFDYKIESYVDIKADFSLLYDAVDDAAKQRNKKVMGKISQGISRVVRPINSISDTLQDISDTVGNIDAGVDVDILGAHRTP